MSTPQQVLNKELILFYINKSSLDNSFSSQGHQSRPGPDHHMCRSCQHLLTGLCIPFQFLLHTAAKGVFLKHCFHYIMAVIKNSKIASPDNIQILLPDLQGLAQSDPLDLLLQKHFHITTSSLSSFQQVYFKDLLWIGFFSLDSFEVKLMYNKLHVFKTLNLIS